MTNQLVSETSLGKFVFQNLDIGGTNTATVAGGTAAQNHWLSMDGFGKICFFLELGTWEAGDSVLTITVQQATTTAGASLKAVTARTHTITDGDLDATTDRVTVEVDVNELDVANGFDCVRVLVAATDNVGTDNISCFALQYQPRYSKSVKDEVEVQLPQDGFGA